MAGNELIIFTVIGIASVTIYVSWDTRAVHDLNLNKFSVIASDKLIDILLHI